MAQNKAGRFEIAGESAFVENVGFGKKSVLVTPYKWWGDQLPTSTGGPEPGYDGSTGYKVWQKRHHATGYLSFGPYVVPQTVGSLIGMRHVLDATQKGGGDELVVSCDCVDYNDGGRELIPTASFKVRDLPGNSDGFVVYYVGAGIEVKPSMKIETRVFCHGGATVRHYALYWSIHYL